MSTGDEKSSPFLNKLPHLAILVVASVAFAQPAAKTAPAQTSALAALHAIDDCEASVEALLTHIRDDDFPERDKASPHRAKLQRAKLAVDKVADRDLHLDLSDLLEGIPFLFIAGSSLAFDANSKSYADALARYHAERDAVATEINTGQRGLLLALLRERARKKAADPR